MPRILAILGLICLLAGGCGADSPPGGGPAAFKRELPAPFYHAPRAWWRANHVLMVDAPWDQGAGGGASFQWQECALCHDLQNSCDRCHAYLGLRGISQGAAASRGGD